MKLTPYENVIKRQHKGGKGDTENIGTDCYDAKEL